MAVDRPAKEKRREAVAAPPAPGGRPRLSFKEQYALQHLPDRIAALEAEIVRLGETLTNPDLYARDPQAFGAASSRLAEAHAELAAAEDDWLTLEMRRTEGV